MNLQGKKVKKKFNFTKSKFRAQRYEDIWPAKVGKPWREKGGPHADRIWRLYCKGRPASKLTWCEPSGDHLDYLWREIQRTSPQITGRAKAMTMLRLEKCNLDTLFQAKHSHCLSSSSYLGAKSLYVFSSTIIQMVSRGFTSREFASRSPFAMKFQILLTPCLHVRRLFLFKAFQPLLVIFLHTVVLETLTLWS